MRIDGVCKAPRSVVRGQHAVQGLLAASQAGPAALGSLTGVADPCWIRRDITTCCGLTATVSLYHQALKGSSNAASVDRQRLISSAGCLRTGDLPAREGAQARQHRETTSEAARHASVIAQHETRPGCAFCGTSRQCLAFTLCQVVRRCRSLPAALSTSHCQRRRLALSISCLNLYQAAEPISNIQRELSPASWAACACLSRARRAAGGRAGLAAVAVQA